MLGGCLLGLQPGALRKKGQSGSNPDIWSPDINPAFFFFFYRFLIKYLHSSYETYPRMLPALLLSSAILGADVRHFAGSSLLPVVAAAATAAAEDAGGADDLCLHQPVVFSLIERCDLFPHVIYFNSQLSLLLK